MQATVKARDIKLGVLLSGSLYNLKIKRILKYYIIIFLTLYIVQILHISVNTIVIMYKQ